MNLSKRTKGVVLEAASNAQIRSGGKGWEITAGFARSPFGWCFIAESPRGICRLEFTNAQKSRPAFEAVRRDWPRAKLRRDDSRAAELGRRIFKKSGGGAPDRAPLRAFVKGTKFQVRLWKALLGVPRGKPTSYGKLAAAVGKPRAARAVGSAVGSNPVAFLIPCHRVTRASGAVGDYHWGPALKKSILAWESA